MPNPSPYIFAAVMLATATVAQAQTAAPAAAPTAQPVPAHKCAKPEFPGKLATERMVKAWSDNFRGYIDCLKGYIGDRNATIEANSKAAKEAVDEFNTNVNEFNEQVKKLNE